MCNGKMIIFVLRKRLNLEFHQLSFREFEQVRESMHSAISMNKTEILDAALSDFSEVNAYS